MEGKGAHLSSASVHSTIPGFASEWSPMYRRASTMDSMAAALGAGVGTEILPIRSPFAPERRPSPGNTGRMGMRLITEVIAPR